MPPSTVTGTVINNSAGAVDIVMLALFAGVVYSVLIIAVFKRNDYLSELFFGRDKKTGQGTGAEDNG